MSTSNFKAEFLGGARAGVPVVLGFIPVGIAFGIMARQAGFEIWQTCGFSVFVYAGASQMMTVGMYAQGASIIAMVLATFLLNFRHLIMSTCVFERIKEATLKQKLIAGFIKHLFANIYLSKYMLHCSVGNVCFLFFNCSKFQ